MPPEAHAIVWAMQPSVARESGRTPSPISGEVA